jgi:hypothetical protein
MVSMCRAGMISKLFYKLINQSSINTFYVLIRLSRVFALFISKLNVLPKINMAFSKSLAQKV